ETRFSRDWSSDVCSSDLMTIVGGAGEHGSTDAAVRSPAAARRRRWGFSLILSVAWLVLNSAAALLVDLLPLHDYISVAGAPNRPERKDVVVGSAATVPVV